MCRVEERVYIGPDGRRQAFEECFRCENARGTRLCPNVKTNTVEYLSRPPAPSVPRDENASPASLYSPPTPTGATTIIIQPTKPTHQRKDSSTRGEATRVIKPEIIFDFGSKKDKGKKYPSASIRSYKRSSLGAASTTSNDGAVESPGSEASYTLRTGFPEATVPPATGPGYTTRPVVPHHRQTSSTSSFTTSSRPPSLVVTSDAESPSLRRAARYPPTIVHNPPPIPQPASPTVSQTPSSPYRTTIAVPRDSKESFPRGSKESFGSEGIFPVDYSHVQGFASSSQASSSRGAAPEITDRDEFRAQQRRERAEAEKRQQEQADLRMAQMMQEEEARRAEDDRRQAEIERGRAEGRARERAEKKFAEHEKDRADEREKVRRMKQQKHDDRVAQDAAERAAREAQERAEKLARKEAERLREAERLKEQVARKEREVRDAEARLHRKERDSRPPTRDPMKRSRRRSMSQHERMEQRRLLAEDQNQIAMEREADERRRREEHAATLVEQQQQAHYWDPRGGNRLPMASNTAPIGRRNSVSARRGSVSGVPTLPPGALDRRNSISRHGVAILQPSPPITVVSPGSMSNTALPPPLLSPTAAPRSYSRPPSARHSSYDKENPFAVPHPRVSNTSQDLPHTFASPVAASVPLDPWDARDMRDALPQETATRVTQTRQPADDRHHHHGHSLRRRGEEFVERAPAPESSTPRSSRPAKHDRARQATRAMGKVVGFVDEDEDSESGSEEEDARRGRSKRGKGKKKAGTH